MNADLEWAIDSLSARAANYALMRDYYEGRHRLDFVPAELRSDFAALLRRARLNMCPAVVTSVRDRLKLSGLTHNKVKSKDGSPDAVGDALSVIWRRNRAEQRVGEIHLEALTAGDAYAVVWPSPVTNLVTIHPNYAHMMTVAYDEEEPDVVAVAARKWTLADKRVAINLYYPDRIEKYVTRTPLRQGAQVKAGLFIEHPDEPQVLNPYGQVPVFHFGNGAGCSGFGVSELSEAIPVQDALNKTLRDMLIGGEEQAFKQRYATGVELPVDPATGKKINPFVVNEFWATAAKDAKFGELEAANLEQLQKVKEGYKLDMAMVTGIPAHYFMAGTGNPPSGEALKTLEFRLTSKVDDRQVAFGATWEAMFKFALKVSNIDAEVELDALWRDTTPRNEKEQQEMIVERVEKLGMSRTQAFKELNYTDQEIERVRDESITEEGQGR